MVRYAWAALALMACTDDVPTEETGAPVDTEAPQDTSPPPNDDPGLAEWPQAYQDFVTSFGGSNFVEVEGINLHYVQSGPADASEAVLLVHGIPVHAYLWRNVLGQLGDRRVIAFDLVGYGRSDRPDTFAYTPASQVPIMEGLVEALNLDEVHLVVQDLGGLVGLRWAADHPDEVQSITMFETLWSTIPDGIDAVPAPFGGVGGLLDQMRDPVTGPVLVGEKNIFLATLPSFTVNGLSKEVQEVYQHPWPLAEERARVLRTSGPIQFPFPADPAAEAFVRVAQDYLEASPTPKLVIDVTPGALSAVMVPEDGGDGKRVRQPEYAAAAFPNVTSATLTPGGHFVQEDLPNSLSETISSFLNGLD
ncbi:MAG: alpha/beta fold hydrolase [Myxococcota bacterium]